jgi:hypothetical protein
METGTCMKRGEGACPVGTLKGTWHPRTRVESFHVHPDIGTTAHAHAHADPSALSRVGYVKGHMVRPSSTAIRARTEACLVSVFTDQRYTHLPITFQIVYLSHHHAIPSNSLDCREGTSGVQYSPCHVTHPPTPRSHHSLRFSTTNREQRVESGRDYYGETMDEQKMGGLMQGGDDLGFLHFRPTGLVECEELFCLVGVVMTLEGNRLFWTVPSFGFGC